MITFNMYYNKQSKKTYLCLDFIYVSLNELFNILLKHFILSKLKFLNEN